MSTVTHWIRECIYRIVVLLPVEISHHRILRLIRKRGHANVMFLASNLSMWRYEKLMDRLMDDDRFEVSVVLVPYLRYGDDERMHNMSQLKNYFDERGIKCIDSQAEGQANLMEALDPDIVFYQQPYAQMLEDRYDSSKNFKRLLCYYPYGLSTFDADWQYRLKFNNVAWKLYYSNPDQKLEAMNRTYNNGRNMVVVGYPDYDLFAEPCSDEVWKSQPERKKRIIWAPHFSITPGLRLHRDSFLWLSDFMLEQARKYADMVQFAFKPHPNLLQELYDYPDWGKKRADEYYKAWRDMENGQLDEGGFVDLFKTSDALIHDCGTFTAEYLYTKKPVMFVSNHIESELAELSKMGKAALEANYTGASKDDVIKFIDDVVIGGNDPKEPVRSQFFVKYLEPESGETVTGNTYCDLVKSIWG